MASLTWSGLSELKEDLRNLPDYLKGEAAHIVDAAANRAQADIQSGYANHRHSGNLADHVEQTVTDDSRYGYAIQVKANSPHAWLFEFGSQARHRNLKTWRPMPAGHVFVPAMDKNRRWMWDQLSALVTRQGMTVTGDYRS
jgi:hypothetical protein